ncbi:hypothetical protein P2H44_03675 [Albimonas sp. CAU 1670]|uniref:hypothetical protein n=1 Tax=Albimonas sp. CAU 1670 TaxID=3032599 RepID=UPI0023DC4387|nr:hypothetical protein [Albimonas sp. CAU 1670]MDF2231645.1 hypothetical protein [Albimonas sp. CAU 1670]
MSRTDDPTVAETRSEDVPEMVKPELNDPQNPAEVGGANAEATGVWRVLRNSLGLAVAVMVVIAIGYAVMS